MNKTLVGSCVRGFCVGEGLPGRWSLHLILNQRSPLCSVCGTMCLSRSVPRPSGFRSLRRIHTRTEAMPISDIPLSTTRLERQCHIIREGTGEKARSKPGYCPGRRARRSWRPKDCAYCRPRWSLLDPHYATDGRLIYAVTRLGKTLLAATWNARDKAQCLNPDRRGNVGEGAVMRH